MSTIQSLIMTGRLVRNGVFYNIEGRERTNFLKNTIYSGSLPGDLIEYRDQNGLCEILRVLERKPQVTIGVVRDVIRKAGNQMSYFGLPLISNEYHGPSNTDVHLPIGTRCIVLVECSGITVLRSYPTSPFGSSYDYQILCDLLEEMRQAYKDHFDIEPKSNSEHLYSKRERVDLRTLPTITVDPAGSKDRDDAISWDPEARILYVHITDIHYHLSRVPRELQRRAFLSALTLYTPEGNQPIYPEESSEGTMSLIAGEDRHTITIELHLDESGQIETTVDTLQIYPSTIRVDRNLDYSAPIFSNPLFHLYYQRNPPPASHINIPKRVLTLDETGRVSKVELKHMTDEERFVQSLMIHTNRLVSEWVERHTEECFERVHASPIEETGSPLDEVDSIFAVKAMKRAEYAQDHGHSGLSLNHYTHYTSPIRRYFDTVVHQVLAGSRYDKEQLEWMFQHLNQREREHKALARLYESWKLCEWIERDPTKQWNGSVVKINGSGVTVLIPEIGLETYVHVSRIRPALGERWMFNGLTKQLTGSHTRKMICIGDPIKLQYLSTDPVMAMCSFQIV